MIKIIISSYVDVSLHFNFFLKINFFFTSDTESGALKKLKQLRSIEFLNSSLKFIGASHVFYNNMVPQFEGPRFEDLLVSNFQK